MEFDFGSPLGNYARAGSMPGVWLGFENLICS